MIIKKFDVSDRKQDIAELNTLLKLPYLTQSQKDAIFKGILMINAGIKGEEEAAYQIDFHYKSSKNWAVIHNLRLELDGNVAQIDHLLIDRMLEIYICESKHFSEGIEINEHGEFAMYYQGKPRGIPSPIEQNNRHKLLLQQAFNSDEMNLPTRLGLKMKPFSFFNMILVGSSAIIKRPQNGKNVEDLDRIIKVDHLYKRINKDINPLNPILFAKQVATMTQMISTETLQTFAENLAALHKPAKKTDWKVRFGIKEPQPENVQPPCCTACNKAITSEKVVDYCKNNAQLFSNKMYCFDCQQKIKRQHKAA